MLEALGFAALATTSSGLAFTLGRLDGSATLDELSADLENGYGARPEDAAQAILRAAEAGAVGGSIEDWDPEHGLYDREQAAERVHAAAEAAHGLDFPFALTARAENHIRGNPHLEDTIERLQAFQAVGADVLYAPGLRNVEEITAVCDAVSKPVNVHSVPHLTVLQITAAGAQRISVGGALTWVAAMAVADAATTMRDSGDLSALAARPPLERWFG